MPFHLAAGAKPERVRYFTYSRGEVSWEEMAKWLDTRDLASWGTHAYILLPKLNINMIRCVIEFLAGHPRLRPQVAQVAKSPHL